MHAVSLNSFGIAEAFSNVLRRAAGNHPAPVKYVASRLDCGLRTARNLYEGENGPSAENLLKAMAEFDEVAAWVAEVTARTPTAIEQRKLDAIRAILEGEA